eukprot:TRINITY_DN13839_c0_g1_i1.p1 TRINITY_DN13839_c0_g1~~TRINITY_DN13839_c0_g1_i1.p1  ORF type:complete len:329 (-),score=104.19 TRINITY_DN13839_c0_g1_i1:126-1112(-)
MGKKLKGKKIEKKKSPASLSVAELIEKGEEKLESLELDGALNYFKKACELEPNNTLALDSLATVLMEFQDFGSVKTLLEKSIQLAPNQNPTKYFNYAQVCEGKNSISNYEKGIAMLKKQLQSNSNEMEDWMIIELKYQLSGAYCSMAEIYLTDECFADNAEINCETYLNEAIHINPDDAQPLMTLASVRISQQNNSEALELLKKSLSIWEDNEPEDQPNMEFRHNTAKMFLELGEELIAIDLWIKLLYEDDQIAEIHYFLGLAYRKCSSSLARQHIQIAGELLEKAECKDDELLKDVSELFKLLKNENVETLEEEEESTEKEKMDIDK